MGSINGDVAPIRRFELAQTRLVGMVGGEVEIEQLPTERPRVVARRVDQAGRISILKHRYHVGRYLAGEQVGVESRDGLLHVSHIGVVIATHARRHLLDLGETSVPDESLYDVREALTHPSTMHRHITLARQEGLEPPTFRSVV